MSHFWHFLKDNLAFSNSKKTNTDFHISLSLFCRSTIQNFELIIIPLAISGECNRSFSYEKKPGCFMPSQILFFHVQLWENPEEYLIFTLGPGATLHNIFQIFSSTYVGSAYCKYLQQMVN